MDYAHLENFVICWKLSTLKLPNGLNRKSVFCRMYSLLKIPPCLSKLLLLSSVEILPYLTLITRCFLSYRREKLKFCTY
jgi:hypothetical protein